MPTSIWQSTDRSPFTSFVLESTTDRFCLTALTLAGRVPPVPVCTLLWLVPQTVLCQPHIRLKSCWRQAVSAVASLPVASLDSFWWVG